MIVAFIGPPGSGKGTIAQLFAKKGWIHFSMGQALREYALKKEKFSAQVARIQKEGKLVPNHITQEVFTHSLSFHSKKNIILDGFPRNKEQTSGVRTALRHMKRDFTAFIYFDVDMVELQKRLSARRQCVKCGKIYGLHVKPKRKGICDVDKGKLILRNDDKPSVIKERFKVYEHETLPVVDWASKHYPVFNINASGSPPIIFKRVQRVLSTVK